MAIAPRARSVLSLRGVTFSERHRSAAPALLELELARGEAVLVEVADGADRSSLIDLCLGLADPLDGEVAFLGEAWRRLAPRERLGRRRRVGMVGSVEVWPAHIGIAEAILLPRLYHTNQPQAEVVADATALARHFGMPGLPAERFGTTPVRTLVRAACVRGFLGTPELVVIEGEALDDSAELAVPMAQAVAVAQDRGGAVLWITEDLTAAAARFVRADRLFRLGDHGLTAVRRPR